MKCLVTGAAGFIGSHLCETLLASGHEVVGLDAFIPYYPRSWKESNLSPCQSHPSFTFIECDLRTDPLDDKVNDIDWVFHLAAMPGLVRSWSDFDLYHTCNLVATQRLLEALRNAAPRMQRFILGSTSSVYGRFASGDETLPTQPISPYGVTKLAAEHLARAYATNYGLPLVILRYFSVYGPRQRPGGYGHQPGPDYDRPGRVRRRHPDHRQHRNLPQHWRLLSESERWSGACWHDGRCSRSNGWS